MSVIKAGSHARRCIRDNLPGSTYTRENYARPFKRLSHLLSQQPPHELFAFWHYLPPYNKYQCPRWSLHTHFCFDVISHSPGQMRFKYLPLSQNAQDTDPRMPEKGGDRPLTRLFRWNFLVPPLLAILLVVFLLVGLGAVEIQKNPTDYGESSLASSCPEARLPSSIAIVDPPSTTWNHFW